MTSILSVSSSRADVNALAPVWSELAKSAGTRLHIALTGAHTSETDDRNAVTHLIPESAVVHWVNGSLAGNDSKTAAIAMAQIQSGIAEVIASVDPDCLVVVGDRLDMIPAALAAVPFNLPIVHLHGGELTFGAVDDRLRHAISKLAHLHLVSGTDAARRLTRMGEAPERVHVVGAPALDALAAQPIMERDTFLQQLDLPTSGPLRLVTVHPETNSADPSAACGAILTALDVAPAPTLLTAANADMGGAAMTLRLKEFAAARPWASFRDTLGVTRYANALRHSDVMVGNSSSGVIEAALFGLPVINVGLRQEGRLRGVNVQDAPADATRIADLLSGAIGQRYNPADVSLYGDAKSGPRMADVLTNLPPRNELVRKTFFEGTAEFNAPWVESAAKEQTRKSPESLGILTTKSSLVGNLRELGIEAGDTILVHSSLKSLGFVVGGGRSVIEALVEAVGKTGTVVMPAFSGDLSDPAQWRYPPVPAHWVHVIRDEMPAFDPKLTPTRGLGAIPELFRQWPGTRRSTHPQSSFAALGAHADLIVDDHSLDFRFGSRSPLGKLEQIDAKVVSIGAPWRTLTVFYRTHEKTPGQPIETRKSPVLRDGVQSWIEYQDIAYPNYWFEQAAEHLLKSGLAHIGKIGPADTLTFRIPDALAEIRRWRKANQI